MKRQSFFKFFSIVIFSVIISCSDDNDINTPDNIITINIPEYPSSGDTITAIVSNLEGELTYSILNQTVSQAIIINGGNLSVGDWLAFDFETNENLLLTLEVSNGVNIEIIEYNIVIENVDDIWAFLNGSTRIAYENASEGDWVWITESEYNDLANYMFNINKSGASDDQLFNANPLQFFVGALTLANNNGLTIPKDDYFFAFKYYTQASDVTGCNVKLSETFLEGPFSNIGGVLPEHGSEFNHFVLKGVGNKVTAESYLGMYASLAPALKTDNSSTIYTGSGNTSTLDNSIDGRVLLQQGLSTSLIQWD